MSTGNAKNYNFGYAWYPTTNFNKYVYASSLGNELDERAISTYRMALTLLSTSHLKMGAKQIYDEAYNNLGALVERERKAEVEYLKKYFKVELQDPNDIKELVEAINLVLNNSEFSTDAIRRIKDASLKEDGSGYSAELGYSYSESAYAIPGIVEKAVESFISGLGEEMLSWSEEEFQDKLDLAIAQSIQDHFNQVLEKRSGMEEKDPYWRLIKELKLQGQLNEYVNKILKEFNINFTDVFKKLKKENNFKLSEIKKATSIKGLKKHGGALYEELYNLILSGLRGVDLLSTAKLNMQKADTILFNFTEQVDLDHLEKIFTDHVKNNIDNSKRIQNIEAIQYMEEQLQKGKNGIIYISDKSYSLQSQTFAENSNFYGGFAAEKPTIQNLEKILNKAGLTELVEDMIFILANSGQGLINGSNYQDVLQVISLNIANFLFDDVVVTEQLDNYQTDLSKMHIFSLNNINIPLSVFLEAAYEAFKNNKYTLTSESQKYVKVDFHGGTVTAPNPKHDKLEKEDWEQYYEDQIKSKSVSIHFFGDFINFIKQNL